MKIDIPLPSGIDRTHRLLHFCGIQPTRASYSMTVFVEWAGGEKAEQVGAIHSYGFGDAMDAQGRVTLGLPGGKTSLEAPPAFDAFIELPITVAERLKTAPNARLTGVISRVKGSEQPESTGHLFTVGAITAEPVTTPEK